MRRESRPVDTYGMRDLYVDTVWIIVRMKRVGRTGSSTSCWIAAARISERNMSVNEKHIPIAEAVESLV